MNKTSPLYHKWLAIIALVVLLGVIVVKLVIWPPCSITTRNECVVDGWSIAGLAGTVLAVAATLLAILGAIAVAYWWTDLNKKVDRRVDEQIKTASRCITRKKLHSLCYSRTDADRPGMDVQSAHWPETLL